MTSDSRSAGAGAPEINAAFFVRALVHELRGDVDGLRGLAAMLCATLTTPQMSSTDPAAICTVLKRTIDLLRARLDQILLLSHNAPQLATQHQPLTVRGLLEAAQAALVPFTVPIQVDCPANLTLHGDPAYLTLALQTALRNAITALAHTPTGRPAQITCSAQELNRRIVITIADTGPGFAPDLLQAFTAHRTPDGRLALDWSGQGGARGIGLLLIDRVAALHSGRVQIGNQSAGGAQIQIELPVSLSFTGACSPAPGTIP